MKNRSFFIWTGVGGSVYGINKNEEVGVEKICQKKTVANENAFNVTENKVLIDFNDL